MTISEAEERQQQLEAELATCGSPEWQTMLRKRIAYLQKRLDWARHVEQTNLR